MSEFGIILVIKIIKGEDFMAHKSNSDNFENMARVGNFTKNAVENFEENIVNKKNYLEEVSSKKSQ